MVGGVVAYRVLRGCRTSYTVHVDIDLQLLPIFVILDDVCTVTLQFISLSGVRYLRFMRSPLIFDILQALSPT